jgi:hypothetical protein
VRVAVGDRVVAMAAAGERRVGERTFELLELRCRWLPLAAGTSLVAPVQVRYAFATRFNEDFLRGRQPLDRAEDVAVSAPAQVRVRALPAPAPPGFGGAGGELTVRASTGREAVRVGESFVLVLEVRGRGNVGRFAPPVPGDLPGFHVQGVVDRGGDDPRRFELDVLALRAGLTAVPPVPFVAFAPARGAYVTLATAPVPVRVEPPAAGTVLPPRVQELVDADARAVAAANAPSKWWAVAAGLAAVLVHTGLRLHRRRTRRGAAVATARAELAAAAGGADAARRLLAFEAFLAAAAGLPAWSPRVWGQLDARGARGQAVAAARDVHAALDAARFGGTGPGAEELLAAADGLLAPR